MGRPKKQNDDNLDVDDGFEEDEDGDVVLTDEIIEKNEQLLVEEKNIKSKIKYDSSIQSSFDLFLKKDCKVTSIEDKGVPIPTGIRLLDTILGGGMYSRFNMIVGNTGSGKSSLCAQIIAEGQNIWGENFISAYIDSEETMSTERLYDLGVVNPPLDPLNDISIEKVFKIVEGVCAFKEKNPKLIEIPSVVIWDSIANSFTEKALASDEQVLTLGAQRAGMIAFYLPKYISKLKQYNISLVSINQKRDDIDMNASPYSSSPKQLRFMSDGKLPGGKSCLYNCFHLVELIQRKSLKDVYGFDSILVEAKAIKNKKFQPNVPVNLVFSYANGFSDFYTNFEMLKEFKYINASAWSKLNSYPTVSFRQADALETYKSNEEWKKCFDADVQTCLKNNYITKYQNTNVDVG